MSIPHQDSIKPHGTNMALALRRWDAAPISINAIGGPYGEPCFNISNGGAYEKNLVGCAENIWHFYMYATSCYENSELLAYRWGGGSICALQLLEDGSVRFKQGDSGSGYPILHVGATPLISFNVWHHWQIRMKAHETLGELEIKIDNVQRVNLSGLDTIAAGAAGMLPTKHRLWQNIFGKVAHPFVVQSDGVGVLGFQGMKCCGRTVMSQRK